MALVATGSHYVFDIVAGIAITLLGGLVALRMRREAPPGPPGLHRAGLGRKLAEPRSAVQPAR